MNIKERIRKMGPFIALVVTFIVIAALNDSFVDPNNLKNLLRQVSINALISFGMTFVILTGGIDLSVGSLLALSSALMGSLIVSGMNPMLAILAACFIGKYHRQSYFAFTEIIPDCFAQAFFISHIIKGIIN